MEPKKPWVANPLCATRGSLRFRLVPGLASRASQNQTWVVVPPNDPAIPPIHAEETVEAPEHVNRMADPAVVRGHT